jgi:hypothetical protein
MKPIKPNHARKQVAKPDDQLHQKGQIRKP